MKTLILYSSYLGTRKASYYSDWLDAFVRCNYFDITALNIVPSFLKVPNSSKYQNPRDLHLSRHTTAYQLLYQSYTFFYRRLLPAFIKHHLLPSMRRMREWDLIILLHSTNANSMLALSSIESYLKSRKGKLLIFVGNEYCLMPEKIRFIKNVEADYVASQLPEKAAKWLYEDCTHSRIVLVPHGLNSKIYKPLRDPLSRRVDIGFIGDRYSLAVGDIERTKLAEYFSQNDFWPGMTKDIRIGRKLRLPREEYARFLNTIRGTIGGESGTYYLEKTDKTQKEIEAFLSYHPKATFDDIYNRFLTNYSNPVSGKAISSRHFEAAGTKTCQILLEGEYNGIFKPDVHYICLKKDYSNIDDVIARFRDNRYLQTMVNETYEYVMENHTYERRVVDIWEVVS
ncbi:MAG: hypothetical protein DRH43_11840 [Deltaproteobacteria bacterium]|nr:MAG: hypothetical protein DRH43_11840 [Deltaproteobacteria bacterium]